MNTDTIEISGNKYPLAVCTRIINGRECGTSMNPAHIICTGCQQMIKNKLQKSLEIKK